VVVENSGLATRELSGTILSHLSPSPQFSSLDSLSVSYRSVPYTYFLLSAL
jgi:hypothetical protein